MIQFTNMHKIKFRATSNISYAHTAIDIDLYRTNSDRIFQLIIMIILNNK